MTSTRRRSNQYTTVRDVPNRRNVERLRERLEVETAAWGFSSCTDPTWVWQQPPPCTTQAFNARRVNDQVRYAAHPDPRVRVAVAKNPTVTASLLGLLSDDPSSDVRFAVAAHRRTPSNVLEQMIDDPHPSVTDAVLRNPNCPTRFLENHVTDRPVDVAKNPTVTGDLLAAAWSARHNVVSATRRRELQMAVAGNDKTPTGCIQDMFLVSGDDPQIHAALLRNPNCPTERLEQYHRHHDESGVRLRAVVAANPNCPTQLLGRLAADPAAEVRWEVAANPNTSTRALEALVHDANIQVRIRAFRHPSTPVDAVTERAQYEHAAAAQEALRRRLSSRPDHPTST